jgi:hypothetical protein
MKVEPGKGALDHPTPGKNEKTLLAFGRHDRLETGAHKMS